jgi:hypothetical protein
MKKPAILVISALLAGNAAAAEYGIGLSAKSDDGWIYAPIDVSPKFRIEPHIRFSSAESDSEAEIFPGTIVEVRSEADTLEVGIGLFGLAIPKESVRVYYGARASYIDGDGDLTIVDEGIVVDRETRTIEGYRVAPTLGFEYLFNEHFTLGGEVTYFYESTDFESVTDAGGQNSDGERSGTASFLILRYFF